MRYSPLPGKILLQVRRTKILTECARRYGWSDTDYDRLAGAFLAGHIIECSAYASGSNFSGFNRFPLETFIESGFPIAEVEKDGSCVITKHEGTGGMVTEETIKCQLLYEIQGNVYLNSDVTAILDHVQIKQEGKNRVRFSGIKGLPPPPTTKLAVFFQGGYESQSLANFAGYSTRRKHKLYETQIRKRLDERNLTKDFDILEFQMIGSARPDPRRMFEATSYSRIFAQAKKPEPLSALKLILADDTQQKPSVSARVSKPLPCIVLTKKSTGIALGSRHENGGPQDVLCVLPMHYASGRDRRSSTYS